jgi:hypothetical protein
MGKCLPGRTNSITVVRNAINKVPFPSWNPPPHFAPPSTLSSYWIEYDFHLGSFYCSEYHCIRWHSLVFIIQWQYNYTLRTRPCLLVLAPVLTTKYRMLCEKHCYASVGCNSNSSMLIFHTYARYISWINKGFVRIHICIYITKLIVNSEVLPVLPHVSPVKNYLMDLYEIWCERSALNPVFHRAEIKTQFSMSHTRICLPLSVTLINVLWIDPLFRDKDWFYLTSSLFLQWDLFRNNEHLFNPKICYFP